MSKIYELELFISVEAVAENRWGWYSEKGSRGHIGEEKAHSPFLYPLERNKTK
jgi:hypothetical protein